MSIQNPINDNQPEYDFGGSISEEMLLAAADTLKLFEQRPPISISPREEEYRKKGRHPLYPPDDSTLLESWRGWSADWWRRYDKKRLDETK